MTPDDDLRRLYVGSRRADEAEAPPFRDVLGRPPRRVRGGAGRALAAVAALVLLVAGARLLSRAPEPARTDAGAWTAPTDFLLESPYAGLWDTTPALVEPVPDYSPLLRDEKPSKGERS